MNWLAGLVSLFFITPVFALGLGEIEGRAIIGSPLHVTIPILGFQGDAGLAACASLLPEGDDEEYGGIRIKVEGSRIHLSTARALTQPILQFRIRLGCSSAYERSFVVLPSPAQGAETTSSSSTALPAPSHNNLFSTLRQIGPTSPRQRSIVLMSSTSLRMLARQRYPGDADARVDFIRRVAQANPDLFSIEDAAFDQRLALGTRLLMPESLPIPPHLDSDSTRTVADSRARPPRHKMPGSPPTAKMKHEFGTARGRLIVGAAGLSAADEPNAAKLSESVNRLIGMMNEQILVQITMIKRIETAEGELAELKRQARTDKVRTAQLESEVRAVREVADRNGAVQLLLAILLGGVVGAWALSWGLRRKAEAAQLPTTTIPPAEISTSTMATRSIPSAFDGLMDSREDILPP